MNSLEQLSCCVKALESQLAKLDERLSEIDTNGKLDEIRKEMAVIAANSCVVINTVQAHGAILERTERMLMLLDLRCPLLKQVGPKPPVRLEDT